MKKDEILKKITPEQFDTLLKTMEALKHSKPSSVTFPPPFRSEPTFWDKMKAFLGVKNSDTLL